MVLRLLWCTHLSLLIAEYAQQIETFHPDTLVGWLGTVEPISV